ncbi:MAG: biliverdin-producing heme oxygenase [Caulobacter sp.]|nr:biliverdin-producing heme oxygenase [Caulobacter sp.]
MNRLRTATAALHSRLELDLDLFEQVSRPQGRRRLVERFHGLHVGAERALAPFLSSLSGLEFEKRSRLVHLDHDLVALGGRLTDIPACPVASPASLAEALGLFYVLEGSTLGGHVIRRQLTARGVDAEGLSFLDPYGPEVGVRWRDFLAVLDRETPLEPARDDAVAGAVTGFTLTHDWLCVPEAVS